MSNSQHQQSGTGPHFNNFQNNQYESGYNPNTVGGGVGIGGNLGQSGVNFNPNAFIDSQYDPQIVNSRIPNGLSSPSYMVGSTPPLYSSSRQADTAKFYESQSLGPRVSSPQPIMTGPFINSVGPAPNMHMASSSRVVNAPMFN